MIRAGRLHEFVCEIIDIRNEEQEEKVMWEYWLHKDFERSYTEFCSAAADTRRSEEPQNTSKAALTEIVRQSIQIASLDPLGEGEN